jgi:hypothetical protein
MKKSNEKVLISYDSQKAGDLDRNVEFAQQGANDLIHIFESFQSYKKITSLDDFETLVSDPLGLFDKTLQSNSGIDLKASGGKIPNPKVIAELYDIDRPSYISIIKGEKIVPGSCKPCAKLKVKQLGKGAIKYSSFKVYQEYLIFDQGQFSINENEVDKKKESFNYYAETENQIQTYHFWINATETINELSKRGLLGEPNAFSKLLNGRITYSYQASKFSVDQQTLLFEIQSLKK